MSQRNPMNERYTSEERPGSSRKSAASAKPKTKAASSVTLQTEKKTKQQKKAEEKAARKKAQAEQRELDRKYYKPDTPRYKNLRRGWWACLIGAILCTIASWLLREVDPQWISMVALFGAYGLIIGAFYIDFSKIKKERRAYQDRMVVLEEKQKKEERAAARAARQQQQHQKGSGKNASRNPKVQAKATAEKEAAEAAEADSDGKPAGEDAPKKKGFLGGILPKKSEE